MESNGLLLAVIVIVAVILLILMWQVWQRPAPVQRELTTEQHEHIQQLYLESLLQAALMREYAIAINSRTGGASQCAGQVGGRVDAVSERLGQTVAYFTSPAAAEEVTGAFNALNKCLESAIVLVKNRQSIVEEKAACKEQARAVVTALHKHVKTIEVDKLTSHLENYVDATLEEVQDIFSGNCNSSLVGYETKVIVAAHQFADGLVKAITRHLTHH